MNKEQINLELIKTLCHIQCALRGLDNLKDVNMHRSVKSILNESKYVFQAFEKHIVKDWSKIINQLYEIDSDMMEVIIEAYQYKFEELKELNIEDVVTIKD